jgi:hypothetical protein
MPSLKKILMPTEEQLLMNIDSSRLDYLLVHVREQRDEAQSKAQEAIRVMAEASHSQSPLEIPVGTLLAQFKEDIDASNFAKGLLRLWRSHTEYVENLSKVEFLEKLVSLSEGSFSLLLADDIHTLPEVEDDE